MGSIPVGATIKLMYTVYILYSESFDSYYIGYTQDMKARFTAHNNGLNKSTKRYIPWKLVGEVTKTTKREAMELEGKLKRLTKQRKRAFIIKHCKSGAP